MKVTFLGYPVNCSMADPGSCWMLLLPLEKFSNCPSSIRAFVVTLWTKHALRGMKQCWEFSYMMTHWILSIMVEAHIFWILLELCYTQREVRLVNHCFCIIDEANAFIFHGSRMQPSSYFSWKVVQYWNILYSFSFSEWYSSTCDIYLPWSDLVWQLLKLFVSTACSTDGWPFLYMKPSWANTKVRVSQKYRSLHAVKMSK